MLIETMRFEEIRREILKDYHQEISHRAVMIRPKYERYLKAKLGKIPSANKGGRLEYLKPIN